jgi:hypothetical protein
MMCKINAYGARGFDHPKIENSSALICKCRIVAITVPCQGTDESSILFTCSKLKNMGEKEYFVFVKNGSIVRFYLTKESKLEETKQWYGDLYQFEIEKEEFFGRLIQFVNAPNEEN